MLSKNKATDWYYYQLSVANFREKTIVYYLTSSIKSNYCCYLDIYFTNNIGGSISIRKLLSLFLAFIQEIVGQYD